MANFQSTPTFVGRSLWFPIVAAVGTAPGGRLLGLIANILWLLCNRCSFIHSSAVSSFTPNFTSIAASCRDTRRLCND